MIAAVFVEYFRYTYGILAIACATGFVASMVLKWHHLYTGEKIIRISLTIEHLVICYASYVAIKAELPATIVGLLFTVSMLGVVAGFLLWFSEGMKNESVTRDRRHSE